MSGTTATPWTRRRFGRALVEMHYQLRTEGDTPTRTACSVFFGTLIGCVPIYGVQLLVCVAVAKMLRLSRLKTYLAAHINNPVTAPFLLALELAVGRWLLTGSWPPLNVSALRGTSLTALGLELLAGSVAVGLVAGVLLGLGGLVISLRWRIAPGWAKLREQISHRYLEAGVFHWEFVRAKLRHDPIYREILAAGLLPDDGVLLDLGCGRGIVLTLIEVAVELHARGEWDPEWPPPPRGLVLQGIESRPAHASAAETASRGGASIIVADLAGLALPPAKAVIMLDVLHYLRDREQERLVRRASDALQPGGVILIREPDTARRLRFFLTRLGERLSSVLRGEWRRRLRYRGSRAWCELLERQGLTVVTHRSWRGTPFSNVVIRARKPTPESPEVGS